MSRVGQCTWAGAIVLLGATTLVGLAHTELGKPILALLPGGCPANLESADPQRTEAFRIARLQSQQVGALPRGTRAWHFALGSTSRAEVNQWALERGVTCETARQGSVLRCSDEPCAASEVGIVDAHLQFDDQERLVAVDLVRRRASPKAALKHLTALGEGMQRFVGASTARTGDLSEEHLAGRRFARVQLEYRYRSYLAKLSATNLGADQVLVREQYQWWPETS